ncbi:MAG: class I SAM-dependent methyltransferase [Helicobacteraceae bacterium]|nr:class I SAM-dependent methyltransferase [Helicobacteraceae bacterium]
MYARFEPLIPFRKEIAALHKRFIVELQALRARSVLDAGCGNGLFLSRLQTIGIAAKGIDLSAAMVENARSGGLNAERIDLKDERGSYDAVSAIFDVVNYLNGGELGGFFRAARDRLNPNGAFIFDVNSLYGFEIAEGDLVLDDSDRFGAVRASFDGAALVNRFTLFERDKTDEYRRFDWQITQYFHSAKTIERTLSAAGFSAIKRKDIRLYDGAKADKLLFIAEI